MVAIVHSPNERYVLVHGDAYDPECPRTTHRPSRRVPNVKGITQSIAVGRYGDRWSTRVRFGGKTTKCPLMTQSGHWLHCCNGFDDAASVLREGEKRNDLCQIEEIYRERREV